MLKKIFIASILMFAVVANSAYAHSVEKARQKLFEHLKKVTFWQATGHRIEVETNGKRDILIVTIFYGDHSKRRVHILWTLIRLFHSEMDMRYSVNLCQEIAKFPGTKLEGVIVKYATLLHFTADHKPTPRYEFEEGSYKCPNSGYSLIFSKSVHQEVALVAQNGRVNCSDARGFKLAPFHRRLD
jgi:hypothetical protein